MAGKKKKTSRSHAGFEYIRSSDGISEYKLKKNGMRVLLKEDHSVPVATVMVTYHVGSRDEAVGYTGATHILEHLMFKGTKKHPRSFELLEGIGAKSNATTWLDRTNYYETFPSEHLRKILDFEADRMRNIIFTKEHLASEMPNVMSELEYRVENDPVSILDQDIWAAAFQAHPYHHPTIGWRSDIENVPVGKLKEFHETFYWPNNATLTVLGNIDTAKALSDIKNIFGKIPASSHLIPQAYTVEPPQRGERRVIAEKNAQLNVVGIAHKTPHGLHNDMPALRVLSRILGQGKSSRLHNRLIDASLATEVYMYDIPHKDSGLFIVYALLTPAASHVRVEKIILDEYDAIKTKGVTQKELTRAIAHIEAETAFSRDGTYEIASNINEALAIGDWTSYTMFRSNVARVKIADIKRAAQTYLTGAQSTIGHFVAKGNKTAASAIPGKKKSPARMCFFQNPDMFSVAQNSSKANNRLHIARKAKQSEPTSGLSITTMKTGVKDAVTIELSMLGGRMFAPKENPALPALMARMLEQGTVGKNRDKIREEIENMGAEISFSADTYRIRAHGQCLKKDLKKMVHLIADQLRNPAFPEARFKEGRALVLAQLYQEKENTRSQGRTALSRALFPKGHPNWQPSISETEDCVKRTTLKEIREYHKKTLGLGSVRIAASGDVSHEDIKDIAKKAFGGWKASTLDLEPSKKTALPAKQSEHYVFIPEKGTTDFYMGSAIGIDRTHPDYLPLLLSLEVLGTHGFMSRLMSTVRDKEGLTYGIYTSLEGANDKSDGYWYIWALFAPAILEKGKDAAMREIRKLVSKGVSEKELGLFKSMIKGRFEVGLDASASLAGMILGTIEQDLPLSYIDEYVGKIEKISAKDVNKIIKKYIKPEKLTVAVAGTVRKAK